LSLGGDQDLQPVRSKEKKAKKKITHQDKNMAQKNAQKMGRNVSKERREKKKLVCEKEGRIRCRGKMNQNMSQRYVQP